MQVSDVVPVACRAAADAGIRSVCVTNFRRVVSFACVILGVTMIMMVYKGPGSQLTSNLSEVLLNFK